MNLRARMAETARKHPKMTPRRLAAAFLEGLSKKDLVALLAHEFQHIERSLVQSMELTLAHKPTDVRTLAGRREALEHLRPLLDKPYRIGDGERRRAGQMTDQDWAAREVMLGAHRQGVERAETVCNRARELIAACNVKCLDEAAAIRGEDVAAVLAEAEQIAA